MSSNFKPPRLIQQKFSTLSLSTQIFVGVFSLQCAFSIIMYFVVAQNTTSNILESFVNDARSSSYLFSNTFSSLQSQQDMEEKLEELELSGRYTYANFSGKINGEVTNIGPFLDQSIAPNEDFYIGENNDQSYFIYTRVENDNGLSGTVRLGFDERLPLGQIESTNRNWLTSTIIYLFASTFFIIILSYTLTVSIRALRKNSSLIAEGNHDTSMLVTAWNSEVENLSQDLEKMRNRMIQSIHDKEYERSIVENIPLPIATINSFLEITAHNVAFTKLINLGNNSIIGGKISDLLKGEQIQAFTDFIKDIKADRIERIEVTKSNGEFAHVSLRKAAINTSQSSYLTLTFQPITSEDQHSDYEYMALYDHLTGLMNRAFLLKKLKFTFDRATEVDKCALLFIDLDRFKRINDTHGHSTGDLVLQQIANRISSSVRSHDIVARFGGDEFGVLLNHLTSVKDAIGVGNKIVHEISAGLEIDKHIFYLGASIGICHIPADATTPEEAMKNGDIAMYHAKSLGGNQISLFNSELALAARNTMEMENFFRAALHKDEFTLHYQPKVSAKSGLIVGCEALIRWQSSDLDRMVGPLEFIPLAESTGLICDLGFWVLKEAIAQQAHWHSIGMKDLEIAINVSVRQIGDTTLIPKLEVLLDENSITGKNITLEITESTMLEDAESFEEFLKATKKLGFRLALDDFGTGYSSLSYLSRFKLDVLKIDATFVNNMQSSEQDLSLIKAIISIAKSLKMETVAEGVETKVQAELLAQELTDYLQGYYFSKPVPADEFTRLLVAQHNQNSALPSY